MSKVPAIKTKRFTLKAVDLIKDKKDLIKNIDHPEILNMLTLDNPYTEKQWEGFVKWNKAMEKGEDISLNWMIYIDNECVGSVSIMRKDRQCTEHLAEIGYWLAIKHWGKGIMTEALKIIVDYAFNELKLHKLKLGFQEDNIGSRRVAEKNGFVFEGKFKDERIRDGQYKNSIWCALFRDDYLKDK